VRDRVAEDVLAGTTLAAVAIPQSLGYAKIAGMPVVTGLYTLLLPMAVFAVLGSSRRLVVAADSATAAILAAALAGLAVPESARYVRLAGLAALLTGGLLLLARLARLAYGEQAGAHRDCAPGGSSRDRRRVCRDDHDHPDRPPDQPKDSRGTDRGDRCRRRELLG
jgi:hypothetical protein